jgi:hypothetical protein
MITDKIWARAGLIFLNPRQLDIERLANRVVAHCETLGHRTEAVHILSDTSAYICLEAHEISLSLQTEMKFAAIPHPVGTYLGISIANVPPDDGARFSRDSLLARSLQALHAETRPDYVRWIDSDVLLTSEVFASAAGPTRDETVRKVIAGPAHRTSRLDNLPDIEATNAVLQKRLADQDPVIFDQHSAPDRLRKVFSEGAAAPCSLGLEAPQPSKARAHVAETHPLRRLSAWFISIAVLIMALPVGIALLVFNIIRGENLRVACQTAALTGTFVSLQSLQAGATTMETLKRLL